MKKVLLAIAVAALSATSAVCGYAQNGNIGSIYAEPAYGVILFVSSGSHVSAPSCEASGAPNRWALGVGTAAGQASLQALLTAYALHKQIFIWGTGDCSTWGDTESISYFDIVD